MNFFDKLEFLMKRDNIKNLKIMSELSGIPYTTLKGFYSRGVDNIKLTTLDRIKKFFDVTLDYLMDDDITDPNHGKHDKQLSYGKSTLSSGAQEIAEKYDLADEIDKTTVKNVLSRYELKKEPLTAKNDEKEPQQETPSPTDALKQNKLELETAEMYRLVDETAKMRSFIDKQVEIDKIANKKGNHGLSSS